MYHHVDFKQQREDMRDQNGCLYTSSSDPVGFAMVRRLEAGWVINAPMLQILADYPTNI